MSLNGAIKEPSFVEREHAQALLLADKTIRPDFIKTLNKGLRAFIFYRNFLSLRSFQKKKKLQTGKDSNVAIPTTIIVNKRKLTKNVV